MGTSNGIPILRALAVADPVHIRIVHAVSMGALILIQSWKGQLLIMV